MTSNQMSEMERTKAEELTTKVKKSLAVAAKTVQDQDQGSVVGAVKNNRAQTLKLYGTYSWTGSFVDGPVGSINAGGTVQFGHQGSKATFIYGEDDQASNPAGYLLAWSMSDGPLQVYVKCGPLSQVYYDGWENAALTNLNSSGPNSSYEDAGTSSSAQAIIQDASGTFPLSEVSANFN